MFFDLNIFIRYYNLLSMVSSEDNLFYGCSFGDMESPYGWLIGTEDEGYGFFCRVHEYIEEGRLVIARIDF